MGDYYAGSITIGGRLSTQTLPEFLTVLREEEVCLDYDGVPFLPTSADELTAHLNEHGHLQLMNNELRDGCYATLEDWLIQHRIGFIRWSSGYGEYLPEVVHYRRKTGSRFYLTDDHQLPLIPAYRTQQACTFLEQGRPDLAYRLLVASTPEHLPRLPPLTITKPRRVQAPRTSDMTTA